MRIRKEKKTIGLMIRLYCRYKKHAQPCMCCDELLVYACRRLEKCPFGDDKPSCKRCVIHCYSPQMRDRMRQVMRYIGPRMCFYAPIETIRHFFWK